VSSYLRVISSKESLPVDLTRVEMVLWTLSNVNMTEFGSCTIKAVHLNLSELPSSMYDEFKYAVYQVTKSEFRGTNVLIPTAIMQSLWNDNTLVIQHQRIGPLNRECWIEYCKTLEFYVYVT
jgi:hypothetical protein